jgi:hypothetical protein
MNKALLAVLWLAPLIVAAQAPLPSERFVPSRYVELPALSGAVTSFDITRAGQIVTRDESAIHLLSDGGASLALAASINCSGMAQAIRELAVDAGGRIIAQCGPGAALQRFTTAGALVDTLAVGGNGAGQVSRVTEISVLADGVIVVSDDGRDRILVFNGGSGGLVREFGPVSGIDPASVSADDPRLYTERLRAVPDNASGLLLFEGATRRLWTVDGTLVANAALLGMALLPPGFGSIDQTCFTSNIDGGGAVSTAGRLFLFCGNASQEADPSLWTPALDIVPGPGRSGAPISPAIGRARLPSGFGEWRNPLRDILVSPSGDLLVATGSQPVQLLRMQRTRRVLTPTTGGIAVPTLVQVAPRTGSTVFDITYRVDDSNSATVAAYVVAFRNASITPANFVRLSALVEGTAANQGNAQPTNTSRLLSWDAASDLGVGTGFANVSFDVLARETGALLDFRFVTIPANVPTSAFPMPLEISATPVYDTELVSVWQWLLASDDVEVALDAGALERLSDGAVLVSADGAITTTGRAYLLSRAGVRQATVAEADRARTGATPGAQFYGRTHQIAWAPVSNNEVGIDMQCHIENPSGYNCADRRNAGYLVVPL